MKKTYIIGLLVLALLLGLSITGYRYYSKIKKPNVEVTSDLYIPTGADFEHVKELITPYLNDLDGFIWVANKKNYPNKIRSGKFKIEEGMSNEALVNYLRGGEPETILLTFNNQDSYEKLAGRISLQIEADSITLVKTMTEKQFLELNGLDENTGLSIYIPNTYEFYWNTTAEEFRERMLAEYKKFWTAERIEKAKNQGLNPIQATTLASIVQKETSTINERPIVAGLYLNRLKDNWPLQADPTVIYALHQKYGQDSIIKRVLSKDLQINSPYNTYKILGLPPGPIGMPDISSLEAVLNPAKHNYYYMCASVDRIGEHEFTHSLRQHNINARKYQQWVNEQGILR
ncbi:endolytic transglycosylase MltG [Namhaeicola litoreus]|uniref:Endolytic murein transglycosylase n=1 Tax=Namhaeicola litoreus TaxID=1052145 RepID=A0ABW3Y5G3_9FLAO